MKRISAPFDESNLSTDFVNSGLFDQDEYVFGGCNLHTESYLGYISGEPTELKICKNELHFEILNRNLKDFFDIKTDLVERICDIFDEVENLDYDMERTENIFVFKFFWIDE